MNDRENDTKKQTDGRQVQQELESQLRAFGDTMSDAFAHGFEGRGEDIGDRAYGVGRAAVDAANYGINEAAKAFRSRRNARLVPADVRQGRDDPGRRDPRQRQKAAQRRLRIAGSRYYVYGDLWHHGGFLSGCGGPVYAQCGGSAGPSAGQLYG